MSKEEKPSEHEVRSFRWGLNIGAVLGFFAGIGFSAMIAALVSGSCTNL